MAGRNNELAITISTAIEKARQLDLHASAYILSMVLVEVREAAKARGELPQWRRQGAVIFRAPGRGIGCLSGGSGLVTKPLISIDLDDPAFFDRKRQPAMFQR
jgi:hypothetical protein